MSESQIIQTIKYNCDDDGDNYYTFKDDDWQVKYNEFYKTITENTNIDYVVLCTGYTERLINDYHEFPIRVSSDILAIYGTEVSLFRNIFGDRFKKTKVKYVKKNYESVDKVPFINKYEGTVVFRKPKDGNVFKYIQFLMFLSFCNLNMCHLISFQTVKHNDKTALYIMMDAESG